MNQLELKATIKQLIFDPNLEITFFEKILTSILNNIILNDDSILEVIRNSIRLEDFKHTGTKYSSSSKKLRVTTIQTVNSFIGIFLNADVIFLIY